jgi:hypothetical protein
MWLARYGARGEGYRQRRCNKYALAVAGKKAEPIAVLRGESKV